MFLLLWLWLEQPLSLDMYVCDDDIYDEEEDNDVYDYDEEDDDVYEPYTDNDYMIIWSSSINIRSLSSLLLSHWFIIMVVVSLLK